ncbi:TIGR04222 domain-containing membrane protein [Streptomyces tateyamensis]|uniref:TIGR04222 domain-containing membrane protein n=1 Tax=Streptomyces tateyamensis TaxID=565073 RepID=UPI0015E8CF7F|nr:TIGR04222 domain-containing membrane protein [Streptomyces tateyamensis]
MSTGAAWLLLLVGAGLRLWPGRQRVRGRSYRPLSPVEIGVLRAGDRGAAQVALVELHLLGAVSAGSGTVRRSANALPRGASAPARAQFTALYGKAHPRQLQGRKKVRAAIRAVTGPLEREQLRLSGGRLAAVRVLLLPVFTAAPVGAIGGHETPLALATALTADALAALLWVLPRSTPRGRGVLDGLRRENADTRHATEQQPDRLLLGVALFGGPVLRERLPVFVRDSGLLTRPKAGPGQRNEFQGQDYATETWNQALCS